MLHKIQVLSFLDAGLPNRRDSDARSKVRARSGKKDQDVAGTARHHRQARTPL
jgi:hypothetical protein